MNTDLQTEMQSRGCVQRSVRRPVRFTLGDVEVAAESWRFNCGPASICAVLDMTPAELRPHMLDFEAKGYTNPTMMRSVLNKLGVGYKLSYRSDDPKGEAPLEFGLLRIQLGGPWTKSGVPMRVRYRLTHWIACAGDEVFDVNAMEVGGWIPWSEWVDKLVPSIITNCCPKQANGSWWPTHALEVTPNAPGEPRREGKL